VTAIFDYLLTSYLVRLACFSLASFFLINSALALAAWLAAPAALRLASRLRPRVASRFLLALRLLPGGVAIFAVAGLCAPSYLWLEPKNIHEELGFWCLALALLCILSLGLSIGRGFRASVAAFQYARECRRQGRKLRLSVWSQPLLVLDSDEPLLAVAGVMQPRIVVSSGVLRALSSQQLDAALEHEQAHLASRDNLKRLLMLLAPDVFPFCRCFAGLERSWMRFTEWAADDQAAAGDSERSVALASALVRVAKMGLPARPAGVAICFVADDAGLSARVDRLLRDKAAEDRRGLDAAALLGAAATIVTILAAAMLQPSAWYAAHRALEHLIR
jgi:hypothetical protein